MSILDCSSGDLTGQSIIDAVNANTEANGSGDTVIWMGIDSLTAGASGVSYVVPFEKMVRGAAGWGGRWVPYSNNVTGSETTIFKSGAQLIEQLGYDDELRQMSLDGKGTWAAAGANYTYQLQPTFNWSYADIYYLQQPGGETAMQIDRPRDQDNILLDTSGELSIQKIRIYKNLKNGTTQNGTTTDCNNIRLRSGETNGDFAAFGVMFYSGNGGPVFVNAAYGGQLVQEFAQLNPTFQSIWFDMLGVTHSIMNGGMNDRTTRTPAEFQVDLETICGNFSDSVTQYIVRPNDPSDDLITQYDSVYTEVAATYGTEINLQTLFGDYATVNGKGQMLDGIHTNEHYQYFQSQYYSKLLFGKAIYKDQEDLIDYFAGDPQ